MSETIFVNLSIIIILAVIISGVMKLLKQPLLIGYIITGVIVGPYWFNLISSNEVMVTFSQIGVALLLFMVGLHLNPRVIKEVGTVSLITGVGQVLFTSIIGFFIAKAFGLSNVTSLYVSFALTFSSTIIIMKLLSDKGELDSLYGRIAVGFLIVQDLIAIIALMIISSMSNGGNFSSFIIQTFLKGAAAIFLIFFCSYLFMSKLTSLIAKSHEFLFLFSIGWCLALASLLYYLGFSIEIGALLTGITLSFSPYYKEISSKARPLRDFFIILFFILLGSQITFGDVSNNMPIIAVFSLFILIGNPLIVMILMGSLGYTKRNSFLAGLTVAQISEFSLILIALGIKVGHLSSEILSIVTMIGIITIAGSTYMIIYSNQLYNFFSKYLGVFEKKNLKKRKEIRNQYDAILFGYNRIGYGILRSLKKIRKSYVVVDFNPETIANLLKLRIPALYGDAYDADFLEELPLSKTKLIISTIPEAETNSLLIEEIRRVNKKAIVILRAHTIKDALELYKKGASYVLTPHFLGGAYLSNMIENSETKTEEYEKEKDKHIDNLKRMLERGIEHPEVERN